MRSVTPAQCRSSIAFLVSFRSELDDALQIRGGQLLTWRDGIYRPWSWPDGHGTKTGNRAGSGGRRLG